MLWFDYRSTPPTSDFQNLKNGSTQFRVNTVPSSVINGATRRACLFQTPKKPPAKWGECRTLFVEAERGLPEVKRHSVKLPYTRGKQGG